MGKPGRRSPLITFPLARLISLVALLVWHVALSCSAESIPGALSAEDSPPTPHFARFDRISTTDGLPDATVYAIFQDRQGFMWFGTGNGLARYDGYQFTVYRNDPDDPTTLAHKTVYAITQTQDGALWIGTEGGLDRFDPTTRTFAHSPVHVPVVSLCEDKPGVLWVGTSSGLTLLDPADPEPSVFYRGSARQDPGTDARLPSGDLIYALHQDREGAIWLGTGAGAGLLSGLDRFDRPSGAFVHYRHDPNNPTSLSGGDVWDIFQDRQGGLWVGTDDGLNRLDIPSSTLTRYQHNPADPFSLADGRVQAVLEDSAGRLWVGTQNGLDQLDRNQNRFVHYRHDRTDATSISDDVILTIYEDRSGVVWFGTKSGLSRYDETASQFALYQNRPESPYRLSDTTIRAVAESESGELWVGTASGGLNRLDRAAGIVTVYRHDPTDPISLRSDGITALCVDRGGDLWVGTDNQWVERFDPETGKFVHYWYVSAGAPWTIVEDRAGDLWIGTSNGLYQLNRATLTATHYRTTAEPALSSNLVTAIYERRDGTLLVGTEGGGVNVWDPLAGKFRIFWHIAANPNTLAHNSVYSFYEEPDGEALWVGMWQGVDRIDLATETITHYTEEDGLLGYAVFAIQADSTGMLWFVTDRGLSRFNPHTETFRNYDARDGLPADPIQYSAISQTRRGEMLIGTSDGLIAFSPDRILENPSPPPLVVTTLSLFNEVIRRDLVPGEPIRLSYEQNFLSFEFAALDYAIPEKNQYAYRLEGIDPAWIQAGSRRRADYPNLRPGKYVFRVRGSNSSGVWNEEGAAVPITIIPPPWETWWFRSVIVLLLMGVALGAYRLRMRSVEARSRALEQQVADRTAELSHTNVLLEQQIAERKRTEEFLAQERTAAAVAAERNRLARELHDSATQSMYAVTLYADAAARLLSLGQPEPAVENLLKLRGTAKEALAEMRMLIFELRPSILEKQGLEAALDARLEAVEGRSGLKTELHVAGEGRLPSRVEDGLYRIAVEALNNALRHARASRIFVALRFEPEVTVLEIADDGIGFDLDTARKHGGLGLPGMTERAKQLGGTLSVESLPGAGTRVTVMVPREPEQREVFQ